MIGLNLTFVGEKNVLAMLSRVDRGIDTLIDRVAEELSSDIADEASGVSSRLGAPWEIEGTSPFERQVQAPEFFAHFLARGTSSHGPQSAPFLTFVADGQVVFAKFVSGIAGDPFDERAIARTESKLDSLLSEVVESYR